MTETLFNYTLKSLILPPGIILLLLIVAFALGRRMPILARSLAVFAILTLYFLSMPLISRHLIGQLQEYPPLAAETLESLRAEPTGTTALVILAGGRNRMAPEYEYQDTPSRLSLERLRYGARLARTTDLPILLSGGTVFGDSQAEAELLAQVLEQDFRLQPKWREVWSRNTRENAEYSARMLKEAGVEKVLLISQAWHLPRAVRAFESQGLTVIPAPTGFVTNAAPELALLDWLPSAAALRNSQLALHEIIGGFWYRMRYRDE